MSDPVQDAARAVIAGELIVIPTDTVYGIATRPDDPGATARLFHAKGRPRELELPVLVPSPASAREIALFDDRSEALVAAFWAGPLTLVLARTERSASWELGGQASTIAVRMPHHPLALAVLARTGPLAVSSANRSGEETPATCDGLERVFGGSVSVYLCEEAPLEGTPSTVVDLTGGDPVVRRAGAVSEAELRAAIGRSRG
jgi:tRNA threonylcarbamoyl adenosine modification protein (Sua5/YciO/YrdC/YwlC family)